MTEAEQSHLQRLALCRADIKRCMTDVVTRADPMGLKSADDALQKLGRDVFTGLECHKIESESLSGAHVFIASDIYVNGGHTAVMGDFVSALTSSGEADVMNCHLILTYVSTEECMSSRKEAIARTGIPFQNVHALCSGHDAAALLQTLKVLLVLLKALHPQRTFLFHHPEDVVACAAALPELSREWYLIHHNDSVPSLGLHLKEVQLIDLSPRAAAFSRALGLTPRLLNLMAPPLGRRSDFLAGDKGLFTASAGSASKFRGDYPIKYADVVAQVLSVTGGRHLHIGPLEDDMVQEIQAAVLEAGVDLKQWQHLPHVESVAQTLSEKNVDLFLVSVPLPGLRATVEVMASGTPCLWHCINPDDDIWRCQTRPEGGPVWRKLGDLASILGHLMNRDALRSQSQMVQQYFDQYHHPRIFVKDLLNILSCGMGASDPRQDERDRWAMHRLAKIHEMNDIQPMQAADRLKHNSWLHRLKRLFFRLSLKP